MTAAPDHLLAQAPKPKRRPTNQELLRWHKKLWSPRPRGLARRGPTKSPHMRAVVAYLRGVGATHVRVVHGGKHPRLYYKWKGEESFYVMAGSPRNADEAARYSIRDLRRRFAISED
jgi:hypothetical protein